MRQHGSFSLIWNGPILVVAYQELWNVEAVVALHAEARDAWSQRGSMPWAMLTDASQWEGGTPEVLERWWVFFGDAVANGLTTVTDILPTSFHALVIQDLADRASSMANYKRSEGRADAFAWLASQGFESASQDPASPLYSPG